MGAYLYCVLPAGVGSVPAALRGIDDATVEAVPLGDLSVWLSRLEQRPDATLDRVRAHNGVIEAAASGEATPVPLRFGQWVADEQQLAGAIGARAEPLARTLERIAGAVEFGVRIADPAKVAAGAVPTPAESTGREYLERLAERDRLDPRGEDLARQLRGATAGLVREERVEPLPSAHGLVTVAHLVDRKDIAAYRAAVTGFRDRFGDLRFLISGPWPPYSFVE